ncbi:methylated-DNA--[protein]-cysteine S-methyltransferase [Clostridium sartagoforme]|uniref:Methylated-DNA--protein-cysteine methyltransferase n=1 Tax=Clostridium sartagoforme TaxID=84031 RepID=A0A4S2DL44_9CLOT|nr:MULTISPECIES: methylated-DNA--[protein]-cysteine S-methyltransferase [Clostridium]MBS5939107.1 methylated-DNA--[protein]-cysteine S-methyltransferase [Clostridium sp.]TGY41704.1 methylated-DNA--[protein]-cysteine S-methyltransferase [Clostridium sartagoforme]
MINFKEILYYSKLNTEIIGEIIIVKSDMGLKRIEIIEDSFKKFKNNCDLKEITLVESIKECSDVAEQINEYFNGERSQFDLKIDLSGTEFRKRVWEELLKIPYGESRSYSDIAKAIGKDKAVRAIGQANKSNPIPIIIPCHRVIGKNKKLIGYAGNHTDIQEKLLNFEKSNKEYINNRCCRTMKN